MAIASSMQRGVGKALSAVGILALIGFAIGVPLAFTAQLGTPLQLLGIAAAGAILAYVLIRIGDLLFDARKAKRLPIDAAGLQTTTGRDARDRRSRSLGTPLRPKTSLMRSGGRS